MPIIEKSAGKKGERCVFEWDIDPVYATGMKELAEARGETIQQFAQVIMDTVVRGGNLFRIKPDDVETLLLAPGQMRRLREITGLASPTGTDVLEALEEAAVPAALRG